MSVFLIHLFLFLFAQVEYINLKGSSKENPAVCKYTGNRCVLPCRRTRRPFAPAVSSLQGIQRSIQYGGIKRGCGLKTFQLQ